MSSDTGLDCLSAWLGTHAFVSIALASPTRCDALLHPRQPPGLVGAGCRDLTTAPAARPCAGAEPSWLASQQPRPLAARPGQSTAAVQTL